MHQHQQQQQQPPSHHLQKQHSHEDAHSAASNATMHCHTNAAYSDGLISSSNNKNNSHYHQNQTRTQRIHSRSHSPHHSRHTSPHSSHHSHNSQHSSPHQSQPHVHNYEITSPIRTPSRNTIAHTNVAAVPHHHHHHRRRRRQHLHSHHHSNGSRVGSAGGSSSLPGAHTHRNSHDHSTTRHGNSAACKRRHRSVTDISSTSVNICHDPACADRGVHELLVRKSCCSSSRTELAQYFAEDLYGTSRRPSSCCTSSDYCYQTDSTSLYGSRSSLSRNNSIKSASAAMRKQHRLQQGHPSYTSMSLRGLNASRPNSQLGSLTSIFDRAKKIADADKCVDADGTMSPKKSSAMERQSSKDALSNELPEYACSPSPIRWSFLADGKSPTEFEARIADKSNKQEDSSAWRVAETLPKSCSKKRAKRAYTSADSSWKSSYDDEAPSTSAAAAAHKRRGSSFHCEFEESTTVLFHQEGEPFNNCCNNYIQCNTYLDQDLQITSEDIHQYLSKGNQQSGNILNNSKNYPFQPSNALEFQYKNNFAANNNDNNNTNTTNTASSDAGECFQRYESRFRRNSSKETNLKQNSINVGGSGGSGASTPLSPTNINLSSSTNNINIVFNACMERNANEVKFINTTHESRECRGNRENRENRENVVSTEAHHSGYLPYTYSTYDYNNMSANSAFDKTLGINELPKQFGTNGCIGGVGGTSTTSEHSSSLHSPLPTGVSFESFDAASEYNLLSQRSSYQYSPTSHTPLSPGSPISATVNPSGDAYMHLHHAHYDYEQQIQQLHSPSNSRHSRHQHHHHRHQYKQQRQHQHQHQHQHSHPHSHSHAHHHSQHDEHQLVENFKLGNAFKKVRKRARKYTEFLRKK